MAFFDKINEWSKVAGEKTNNAIEIGKLNAKILSDDKEIANATAKIGQKIIFKLDNGETLDDDIMDLYEEIKNNRNSIDEARTQIELLKAENTPPVTPEYTDVTEESGGKFCTACGAKIELDAKFCQVCGAKQ